MVVLIPGNIDWFDAKETEAADRREGELTRRGMFKSIGVGTELAPVKGDLPGAGFTGLEVNDAKGTIFKRDDGIKFATQENFLGETREGQWLRFDPPLAKQDMSGRKLGGKVGSICAGEEALHQQVNATEDLGKGGWRAVDAQDDFEVKAARAFVPKEGEIGRAESESCHESSMQGFGEKVKGARAGLGTAVNGNGDTGGDCFTRKRLAMTIARDFLHNPSLNSFLPFNPTAGEGEEPKEKKMICRS